MGMFYKLMIITIQGPLTCEYDYCSKHSLIVFLFTMLFNFGFPLFPTWCQNLIKFGDLYILEHNLKLCQTN